MAAVRTHPPESPERSTSRPTAAAGPRASVGYRTFSPKLAPALQATGGVLLVVGGLGLHLRVTRTFAEGALPETVLRAWGHAAAPGWLLAIVGLAAAIAALAWRSRSLAWKAAPAATGGAGIGVVVWRLRFLDERAAEVVAAAQPAEDLFSLHASFGWGAWLAMLGAILLGLALLVGALRQLDLRAEARS